MISQEYFATNGDILEGVEFEVRLIVPEKTGTRSTVSAGFDRLGRERAGT
jgi:hypothetical protein